MQYIIEDESEAIDIKSRNWYQGEHDGPSDIDTRLRGNASGGVPGRQISDQKFLRIII